MIKYNRYSRWLEEYVESAKDLFDYKNVKKIYGYKVSKGKKQRILGQTTEREGKFVIFIRALDLQKDGNYKNSRMNSVLETLAHELAHTKCWPHDSKHFRLTALILLRFSKILKKHGIKDVSLRIKNNNYV